MIQKHFVEFYSPGTFVAEVTTKEIDSWNVDEAVEMSKGITERYGAKPYGFRFITRSRGPDDLDSSVSARSKTYYINCKVETLAEIEVRNDPKEEILRSNMRINGYDCVVTPKEGWKTTLPLFDGDVVL